MENIANENVIATRLDRCILDPTHLKQIRDAVERTHKIVTDGTELIALHLTKRLQSGMQLPLVNAAWVKSVFMEVSSGNGKRTRTDDDLAKTRVRFMSSLVATSRQSLDQVLMAEAIAFTASFNTNLHRHLRKRIYKFVRLHFADKRRDRPLDEYKKHKQTLMFIASDLCKPSGVPFESDAAYHDWVTRWRTELELSRLPDWDMSENVKMHQTDMLQASWKINKAFEAAEEATFSICPIRRHFVPRFVHFDTKAIATVLSTGLTDHQKHVNRLAEAKRKERAKRKADRERIGVPVRDRLQLTPHALTEWNTVAITDEYTAAVCVVQRLWRGFFTRDVIATCTVVGSRTLNHKAAVRLQQNMRGWLVRHRVIRKAFQTKMASQLQASKEIQWSSILSWNGKDAGGKKIKVAKDKMFAGSLRTDGVSVRLFMKRIGKAPAKKTNAPMRYDASGLPRHGLYTIDQLKYESRLLQQAQVIGADPGKRELLVCVDIDEPSDRIDGKVQSARYTSAQRRAETLVCRHDQLMRKEMPEAVAQGIRDATAYNSRSPTLETLQKYFACRRSWMGDAYDFFVRPVFRQRAWRRFSLSQKSLTDFVRRIKGMSREDAPMILAYGSWANVAGRPGAACNKGMPSCIGKGLRAKLSTHFIVATTPEAWTSKTCSCCGSLCGPCEEVDLARRAKMLGRAKTEEETKRAERFSVRGLRRCQNEECAVYHNRDHNAAFNIGIRFKTLFWPHLYASVNGGLPVGVHDTDVDATMTALSAELFET